MKVLTAGRTPDNDIVFNVPQVSRHHAQLVRHDNGSVTISDMGSKNGTFVNRRRIYGETLLSAGDRVKVANILLEWEKYFPVSVQPQPLPKPAKSNNRLWIVGGIAATVVILIVAGLLFTNQNRMTEKDIIFTGNYPPLKLITVTEDNREYEIEAFAGQLEMIFDENIPVKQARSLIKSLGGKVIAQISAMRYFLVEVQQGSEAYFLHQAKNSSTVSFANLHVPLYPCHATIAVIDNFSYVGGNGHTHGSSVSEAVRIGCDNCATWEYNAGDKKNSSFSGLYSDIINRNLEDVLKKSDGPLVINMSFGPGFAKYTGKDGKKYAKKWNGNARLQNGQPTTETDRKSYIENYKDKITGLIDKLKPYKDRDFVITKSSGNEGCDVLDKEILNSLYESLDYRQREIFDKHIVLVGSIDSKVGEKSYDLNKEEKDDPEWVKIVGQYGNRPANYNPMYTAYNISHLSYKNGASVDGTSFSSPEVAGQIARLINDYEITATGALEIVKQVTKENASRTGTPGVLDALELDRKAMEIAYKYKQPSRISGNVSVTDESYKPETRNTKKQDSSESETFTLEANGNHNYQDFHLRDGSLIQCGLYSFGVGDLTLKITSFAPYPVSVSWTLDAPYISPKHGSGNIAAKGQAGIWDDFRMNGENCKFYGVTITVKKLKK